VWLTYWGALGNLGQRRFSLVALFDFAGLYVIDWFSLQELALLAVVHAYLPKKTHATNQSDDGTERGEPAEKMFKPKKEAR